MPSDALHQARRRADLTAAFASASELSPEWRQYLDAVYDVSTLHFPFSIAWLNVFYERLLPETTRQSLRVREGCFGAALCPHAAASGGAIVSSGDLYRQAVHLAIPGAPSETSEAHLHRCALDVCQAAKNVSATCRARDGFSGPACPHRLLDGVPSTEAALRPVPRGGYPSFSLVEIVHHGFDPPGFGYWAYIASGSGIYVNVSRTIAFDGHAAAIRHFCPNGTGVPRAAAARSSQLPRRSISVECTQPDERGMVAAAAAAGYDTVQFTRFVEYGLVKAEVVLVRHVEDAETTRRRRQRGDACPSSRHARLFRSGWGGVHACRCRPRRRCWQQECALNCGRPLFR